MNKTPQLLINNGFVTDENGVLTEMVIPSSVITQNIPSIVTTYATTINWIPSNAATLVEFNAPKMTAVSNKSLLKGFTNLKKATLDGLISYAQPSNDADVGLFYNCTALTDVSLALLETYSFSGSNVNTRHGMFYGCASLTNVNLPKLNLIQQGGNYNGMFYNCASLTTITLPSISKIERIQDAIFNNYSGVFYNCAGLQNVQLGSVGHPVTAILSDTFTNCTQSGLTITIYTSGGASLAGEPWGATNADIEYEEA